MDLLAFDWKGMIAHFRQFDTNSSSLSYSLPPPTVIAGTVAGLLELERDSYYDLLSRQRMKMAVQLLVRPRKIMQTVNYAKVKSRSELYRTLDSEHTQIPMELVVAETFPKDVLHYRIFLQFQEVEVHDLVEEMLRKNRCSHIPFMGSAPFFSWLEWPGPVEVLEKIPPGTETAVNGAVDLDSIEPYSIVLESGDGEAPAYFREHMRREFGPGREPGPVLDVLWEKNSGKVRGRFKQPVYRVKVADETSNILLY